MKSIRGWRWIILAGLMLAVLLIPFPALATKPSERVFHVEASRFEYTPAILAVNPGDRVTIELVATDVVHGLSIEGYNLAVTADPGQMARLSFTANRQGSFRFRCTVTCGNMHPFMIGKLKVGQNNLFWRAVVLAGIALVGGVWRLWK